MIRTVWLAIACLIGIAALTVIKVGTTSFEASAFLPTRPPASSLIRRRLVSSDPRPPAHWPKRTGWTRPIEDDAVKPVRPIAITTKVAAAAASEASKFRTELAQFLRQAAGARLARSACS